MGESCGHPRGQYEVGCGVCDVKKRRAQQRRKLRTGDGAPSQRFSSEDVRDIQESIQHLRGTGNAIDLRLDEMRTRKSDAEQVRTLAQAKKSIGAAISALEMILTRHPTAVEAVEAPRTRRYRRRD